MIVHLLDPTSPHQAVPRGGASTPIELQLAQIAQRLQGPSNRDPPNYSPTKRIRQELLRLLFCARGAWAPRPRTIQGGLGSRGARGPKRPPRRNTGLRSSRKLGCFFRLSGGPVVEYPEETPRSRVPRTACVARRGRPTRQTAEGSKTKTSFLHLLLVHSARLLFASSR